MALFDTSLDTALNIMGTGVALYLFYPIKMVQIRLQNQAGMKFHGLLKEPYKNTFDACKTILKKQSHRAFWQGGIVCTLSQLFYRFADRKDQFLQVYRQFKHEPEKQVMGAWTVMAFSSWLKHPFHVISLLTTVDIGTQEQRRFKSPVDIYYHAEFKGIYQIFRGYGITFTMYCYLSLRTIMLMREMEEETDPEEINFINSRERWTAEAIIHYLIYYPITTIQNRLIMMHFDRKYKRYYLLVKSMSQIYKENGIRGFYRGMHLHMLAAPILVGSLLFAKPEHQYSTYIKPIQILRKGIF